MGLSWTGSVSGKRLGVVVWGCGVRIIEGNVAKLLLLLL